VLEARWLYCEIAIMRDAILLGSESVNSLIKTQATFVMPGLVPGIHVFALREKAIRPDRDEPGYDECGNLPSTIGVSPDICFRESDRHRRFFSPQRVPRQTGSPEG
jgi:hypothetical protein